MKRPFRSLLLAIALFMGIGFVSPQANAMAMDANGAPYVVSRNIYTLGLTLIVVTQWSNGDTSILHLGL